MVRIKDSDLLGELSHLENKNTLLAPLPTPHRTKDYNKRTNFPDLKFIALKIGHL